MNQSNSVEGMNSNQRFFRSFLATCSGIMVLSFGCAPVYCQADQNSGVEISFNRKVRPILAAKCFSCHGPDEETREADLRLDSREAAVDQAAFNLDNLADSAVLNRIFSTDPDEQMPPPDSGEVLSDNEKQLLKDWILEGAIYEKHWAFVKPVRPAVPDAKRLISKYDLESVIEKNQWTGNPIDAFVLRKMFEAKKAPNISADKYSLIRRVYLDLIGLPPTSDQADAFVKDQSADAYEKVVDQLLRSDAYGERWARVWLDLARYADTNGYEKDRPRTIWPYRDWVIKAINADMPFDQFSIEQLAGDMLPHATEDQKIATGFHRNTMLNEEGGIDPLEYRFYAMVDRVATTGTIWMGMSIGCAQCHTHKYDPILHTDYYSMMAMLNNADEPDFPILTDAQSAKQKTIEREIKKIENQLARQFHVADETKEKQRKEAPTQRFESWLESERKTAVAWEIVTPIKRRTNSPNLYLQPDGSMFASGDFTKRDTYDLSYDLSVYKKPITAIRLEVLPDARLPAGGPGNAYYEGRKGDFFLSELILKAREKKIPVSEIKSSFGKISIGSGSADAKNVLDGDGSTGWSTSGKEGTANQLVLRLEQPSAEKLLTIQMIFERHFVASLGRFRISFTTDNFAEKPFAISKLPADIESLIAKTAPLIKRERETLVKYFLSITPLLKTEQAKIAELRKQLPKPIRTMVMRERPIANPRKTVRYHRGEYLNPREEVSPMLPVIFRDAIDPKDARRLNRLDFAKWLVSVENPLSARTEVNRAWQQFFGKGLVRSPGDFGTQSDPPTHPELLDWLSVEFQSKGWSRKKLHRLMVTSATYKQSSHRARNEYTNDPDNEFYTRGPRFRIDGEMVRDIMLSASGKLSRKMFGPSVFPPQPSTVTAMAYGGTKWNVSKGEDRFRRSLYTFSKRTAPFAAYQTFNAPTGENCIAKRNRSNSPLQALTLLNDEMFLELAREASKSVLESVSPTSIGSKTRPLDRSGSSDTQIATAIFRRFLVRPPTDDELNLIMDFKESQIKRLEERFLDTELIAGKGGSTELAAWTLVARSIMSLDEVITKP